MSDIRQKAYQARMTLQEFFKKEMATLNEDQFISSLGVKSEEYLLLKASQLLKVGSTALQKQALSLEFLDYRKLLKRILMMRMFMNWPLCLFSMEPYR